MGRLYHYSTTGGVCLLMGAFCGGFDGCWLNNPSGLLPRQAFGQRATVSRGRDRAAPLPTHLLRICAGALKCPEQWGISKLESGQSPTSSRQGVLVCGALRLPHDLICLPLLFPQNSLRDFCGNPERQESAFSPLTQGRPTLQGSQKRFCEAKDFLGKGDAGVKSAAVAVRRSLAYAPCGDAGGKGDNAFRQGRENIGCLLNINTNISVYQGKYGIFP